MRRGGSEAIKRFLDTEDDSGSSSQRILAAEEERKRERLEGIIYLILCCGL